MKHNTRNTFNILFFIKKNQIKKSGLATIMVRLTINGEQTQFSSNLSINPALWDIKSKKLRRQNPYCDKINMQLDSIQSELQSHYISLSQSQQYVSVHRLKQAFMSAGKEMLLSYQFREQVKIYRSKSGRNICTATTDIYVLTLNRLIEFLEFRYKVSDILIYKIDLWFLERFYAFLRKKYKCSNNTTIKYMKRFASVMNFAQKTGLIQINPFNIFRFHIEKKEPVYLTEEELKSIIDKNFISNRLAIVRDAFVFSAFTGLSFSDIKNLKFAQIIMDKSGYRLRICRTKTGSISYIPLLDIPLKLIEKYTIGTKNSPEHLLFPLRSNQNTNEYLKEIADICQIKKKISFHVARHSFAVIALNNGISLETLSKMLGHTSIRTTQVYGQISCRKINTEMEKMKKQFR